MELIERMREFGILERDARKVFAMVASHVGKPTFRTAVESMRMALIAWGVTPMRSASFINSITVAQLMEIKKEV